MILLRGFSLGHPFVWLTALAVLTVVGFFSLLRSLKAVGELRHFTVQFQQFFRRWFNSGRQDWEAYQWLIANSGRIQREMGTYGEMAHFSDGRVQVTNYPLLYNAIPTIRDLSAHNDFGLEFARINWFGERVDEALIRYGGALDEQERDVRALLRNPLVWFREGVRLVLALPFSLLWWLGIFSAASLAALTQGRTFRLSAGLVALIGFIAAIFGIVSGWHDMTEFISKLL